MHINVEVDLDEGGMEPVFHLLFCFTSQALRLTRVILRRPLGSGFKPTRYS